MTGLYGTAAEKCGRELEWSEFAYVCGLPNGHSGHHSDSRFGRFEWRDFENDPEPGLYGTADRQRGMSV